MDNNNNSKKNNFIMQAGILAMAGFIVRIIGVLYRTPLVMIIGDEGNGYYNTAYNIYTIILMISTYSIPAAISKVIAAKLSLNEYRNAFRLFLGGLVYVVVMGIMGSSVCYFLAGYLVGQSSAQVLKLFAPTIFLSGLLGTFRGFFQAQRTMFYTSVSQVIEQIFNAAVSIGAALLFTRALAGQDATTIAIGGAKGSALGTGAGVLGALIYMVIVYIRRRTTVWDKMKSDHSTNLISPKEVGYIIQSMVTPVILSTCIYNLSAVTNLKLYQEISMRFKGYTEATATTLYGLYSGKSTQIINIPIAIAAAMSSAIIPTIAHTHERGEYDESRRKIAMAIKTTMLIAIPCAVGLCVLSKPVTTLLYPQKGTLELVSNMIKVLSITVIFYCLSTLSNAVLQGAGHVHLPVIHAAIALVVQSIVVTVLLFTTPMDIFAVCIATIVYSFMMCLLNGMGIKKYCGYHQEVVKTFVLPFMAALWMGLVAAGTYNICDMIGDYFDPGDSMWLVKNAVGLVISIFVAALVYAALILHYGVATADELRAMPKGDRIVAVCRKLKLLQDEDIITRRRKKFKKK